MEVAKMESIEYLPEMSLRFALAVVLSGAIGLERQRKGRGAGLRTHVLVCLGSTLAVSVADLFAAEWVRAGTTVMMDKGRIAAGVITGVGFLGAGTIMNVGAEHRGLTTAAMLWFVATLGIAIGAGYYWVALVATAFALMVVLGLGRLERFLPAEERLTLKLSLPHGDERVVRVERFLRDNGYRVAASRMRIVTGEPDVDMTFEITSTSDSTIEELADLLRKRFASAKKIVFER